MGKSEIIRTSVISHDESHSQGDWANSFYWNQLIKEDDETPLGEGKPTAGGHEDEHLSKWILQLSPKISKIYFDTHFEQQRWILRAVILVDIIITIYSLVRVLPLYLLGLRVTAAMIFLLTLSLSFSKRPIIFNFYKRGYHALILSCYTLYFFTLMMEELNQDITYVVFFSVVNFSAFYGTGCLLYGWVFATSIFHSIGLLVYLFCSPLPVLYSLTYLMMVIIVMVVGNVYLHSLEKSRKENFLYKYHLETQSQMLVVEKARSEHLLNSILPPFVITILKEREASQTMLQEPISREFPDCTILFCDIVAFTSFASHTLPQDLVALLNEVFTEFDDIMSKHRCERIKTLGDCYVAAGGLMIPSQTHPQDMVDAALLMLQSRVLSQNAIKIPLKVRIGVATGGLIAGVIGINKFQFDVWGDTVTLANALEQTGIEGRIHIADSTFNRLPQDLYALESNTVHPNSHSNSQYSLPINSHYITPLPMDGGRRPSKHKMINQQPALRSHPSLSMSTLRNSIFSATSSVLTSSGGPFKSPPLSPTSTVPLEPHHSLPHVVRSHSNNLLTSLLEHTLTDSTDSQNSMGGHKDSQVNLISDSQSSTPDASFYTPPLNSPLNSPKSTINIPTAQNTAPKNLVNNSNNNNNSSFTNNTRKQNNPSTTTANNNNTATDNGNNDSNNNNNNNNTRPSSPLSVKSITTLNLSSDTVELSSQTQETVDKYEKLFLEKTRLHSILVKFVDPDLEEVFKRHTYSTNVGVTQVYMFMGLAMLLVFSISDLLVDITSHLAPLQHTWYFYVFTVLLFIWSLSMTIFKKSQPYFEMLCTLLMLSSGLCVVLTLYFSAPEIGASCLIRICAILFYENLFFPARLIFVFPIVTGVFVIFHGIAVLDPTLKSVLFSTEYVGIITFFIVQMFSTYVMKRELRNAFVLRRLVRYKGLVLNEERKKTTDLLLNILPATIAEKLQAGWEVSKNDDENEKTDVTKSQDSKWERRKSSGRFDKKDSSLALDQKSRKSELNVHTVKTPYIVESYSNVTTLFIGIEGMQGLPQEFKIPSKMVGILNELFTHFDRLANLFHVEKIKTNGTVYMAVGGLHNSYTPHSNAAQFSNSVAEMALAARTLVTKESGGKLNVKIGIAVGPSVAGVVGTQKFVFDIWGDTINCASRMESTCPLDKIQVTEEAYAVLKPNFAFSERGSIVVKGKGILRTYFLLGKIRDKLSNDDEQEEEEERKEKNEKNETDAHLSSRSRTNNEKTSARGGSSKNSSKSTTPRVLSLAVLSDPSLFNSEVGGLS